MFKINYCPIKFSIFKHFSVYLAKKAVGLLYREIHVCVVGTQKKEFKECSNKTLVGKTGNV